MSSKILKILACVSVVAACTHDDPATRLVEDENRLPQAYTVNYPLAFIAEYIGGDSVSVVFPAPADVDPAYWSPPASIVAEYQQADLILLNGAGYAAWIQRATLPSSRLVDTSAALADKLIPLDDAVTHTHGPTGDHSHSGDAFTTWLDMELAIAQSRAVFNSLVGLRPERETEFRERLNDLERELGELDARLKVVAERIGSQPLLFSHPVYQYLAAAYGLHQRSLHWEPNEMPGDDQWRELADLLAVHTSAWMIWEDEPLADTVKRLEGMGIESVVFQPCGNRPAETDFMSVMRENVSALETAFPAPVK